MYKSFLTSTSQCRGYWLLMFLLFSTGSVFAQNVWIPDPNFKQALVDDASINTNGDDEIQVSEAARVYSLNIAGWEIADLTGIEAFTRLNYLFCPDNNLTQLDLTQNTELYDVNLNRNRLEHLALPDEITYLEVADNSLTYLDVTHIGTLNVINVNDNRLNSLDLSRNYSMLSILCRNNNLNFLNLKTGTNTEIYYFQATGNPNMCVQVDNHIEFSSGWSGAVDPGVTYSIQCDQDVVDIVLLYDQAFKQKLLDNTALNINGDNEIQKTEASSFDGMLDVSNSNILNVRGIENFTGLTGFIADNNNLTAVDLSKSPQLTAVSLNNNNLWHLNLKNGNSAITSFSATGNANLTCVQVDDPAGWSGGVDAGTSFSSDCGKMDVYIPDKLFLDRMIKNTGNLVDINKDRLIQVYEAQNYTGRIDISGHFDFLYTFSTDLTGFEAFINTTGFIAYYMGINSADFSQNKALKHLTLYGNKLTYLNVQNGNNHNFVAFDMRRNNDLRCIQVDDAAYSEANWTFIEPGAFYSTNCGVVADPVVHIPDVNFKNVLVANAAINTNADGEIQVSEAESFAGQLKANSKKIVDLTGIEAFKNLKDLRVHNNRITQVDLSANLKLVQLHIQDNKLTALDLAANTKLDMLRAQNNLLGELDVSANVKLRYLEVTNNRLTFLNAKNTNNRRMYKFFAKNNPDLSCIEVDDATYAAGAWSATVDPGAHFSEDCSEGGARIAAEVEILKAINISVYPNPSSDFVKVDADQELDELYLYAVNGDRMNVRFEKGEADIRNLKNGIYILRMYRAGQEYAFKLVKN